MNKLTINKRVLGRTGLEVSEIGFGAWCIGGAAYGSVEEKTVMDTVMAYIDAGGNFIDTARVDAYGNSESILGALLSKEGLREKVYLSTKTMAGSNADTLGQISKDLEESLRQLKTDYVDIYFLHFPPEEKDTMNRALDILENLKNQEKIRYIGASIKGPNVTQTTEDLCNQYMDEGRVDVFMVVYSILRQKMFDTIKAAKEKDIGIIVRTSLESGLLTGAYPVGHQFDEKDHRSRYKEENLQHVLTEVSKIKEYAIIPPYSSLAQAAIRFAMQPEGVSTVIAGAQNPDEVKENLKILSFPPLEGDLLQKLTANYIDKNDLFNFF